MRIVNVYNGDFLTSSQGGGMRYLRDLMIAQHRKGFDVVLLAVGKGEMRQIMLENVPITYVPISPTLNWPRFLLNLLSYFMKNRWQYTGEIFHLHRVYFAPAVRMLVRKAHIVVTIHSKTFAVLIDRYPFAGKFLPLLLKLEKYLLRTCVDRLSAAGDYAISLYHERHGLPEKSVVLLRCPSLMLANGSPAPELSDAPPRRNILFVGRLAAVKRPLSIIELFRRASTLRPNLLVTHRLVLVGEGEDSQKVKEYIASVGLNEHVKLMGSVPAARMPDIYAGGCCLILLSSSEVAPFTVKEALTAGLPVFATDVGIVPEYIPSQCGVVISVENPESQAEKFLAFIDHEYMTLDCRKHADFIREKEQLQFETGLNILYGKSC